MSTHYWTKPLPKNKNKPKPTHDDVLLFQERRKYILYGACMARMEVWLGVGVGVFKKKLVQVTQLKNVKRVLKVMVVNQKSTCKSSHKKGKAIPSEDLDQCKF